MLDLKYLREHGEVIKKALRKKHVDPVTVDAVLNLDKERRHLQKQVEELKARQNTASKTIPKTDAQEKKKLLAEMKIVKEELTELEEKYAKSEETLQQLLIELPNPPAEDVPEGESDDDNTVVTTWGKKPDFGFTPKDHTELCLALDLLDVEHAVNASGARFVYLKNEAVQLQFALMQFVLQKLIAKGFTPVIPPVLVKEKALFATGFFPADRNEIYHVNPEDDDLYLVGTSEVALAMLHADEIIDEKKLPLRYCAYSSCFRREAGSYGKDVHGMIRVHQFDKIEMFSFCHPEKSNVEHEFLAGIEQEILQELNIPYRVVNVCGGELGAPAAKKFDTEAWIPSQEKYREVMSCSNCTDFQARRAGIRYKKDKTTTTLHTLNGTAVAIGRALTAIIENYQKQDGSIEIPKVLQTFMGRKIIARK